MENYKNNNDVIPSLLHICINPPPCLEGEKEMITNGRKWCKGRRLGYGDPPCREGEKEMMTTAGKKWCKGRSIDYGSVDFNYYVDKFYKIYKLREVEERQERINQLDESKELKEQIIESSDELESFRDRLVEIQRFQNEFNKENSGLEDLVLRFEKLTTTNDPEEFKTKTQAHLNRAENKSKFLKDISTSLQEQKVRCEVGQDVITVVRDNVKKIKRNIREETKNEDKMDDNVNNAVNHSMQNMHNMIKKLNDQTVELQRKIDDLNEKQDQVLELSQNINENVLRQYIHEWHRSRLGFLKNIVLAPFKALDFIIFRPARYAFWYFFGRFFYLLWGILMLLVLLICFLSGLSAIKQYHPELMATLYDSAIYLWSAALQSGSIAAETLKPMFGDSVILVFEGIKTGSYTGIVFLWERLIDMFVMIFKTVTNKVGPGLVGWLW
jgi:hypothetical protein